MSFIQQKQASLPTIVKAKQGSSTWANSKQSSTTMVKQLKSREPQAKWDESGISWDDGVTYWDRERIKKQKQASTTWIKGKQAL